MKLMRSKFVAIVVTLAMVLSMLAVPVVSADTTKPATSADAAAFLSSKNLLQGDNGNLMLDQTLTREQMMVILSRLLGQEDTAKNYDVSKMTFTDVPQTDGYAPYVAWAENAGYAQGYSSTQFGFGQSLTAQQTKAFFLRALGETVDDSNWNDVDTMAADYGISDNSTVVSSAPITRGDMALLMSNTVYATNIDGDVLGEKLGVLTPVVTPPTPTGTQPVLTNVVASATTTSADTVTVTGTVTPASATTVTVGGTAATVGADGSFTATYTLDKTAANGLNNIAVVATNGTLTATQNVAVTYVPNVAAAVTAAVASDSPVSNVVVSSGANVPFLKVALTANGADAKVTSLQVTRSGLSNDADVPAIRVYDGSTQKGGYGVLNSAVATFDLSYDPILLTAGQTKEITIKADTGATAGKYVVLGVTNVTAVKASDSSAATVTASYPLNSATMQISAVVAGTLAVHAVGGNSSIVRGSANQIVGNFTFANNVAGSSEDITLNSVTFTRQGSSLDSDFQSIGLYDGSTALGTATSISGGKATIAFTTPLVIKSGTTKTLTLETTLAPGTTSSTNATFAIYASTDVSATGATSGDSIVIATPGGEAFPETSGTLTFSTGTLSIATGGTVTDLQPVKGQNDVTFVKVNLTAGAGEGVKIRKIRVQRGTVGGSTGADNDLTNLKVVDNNGNQVGPTVSGFVSGYATFDFGGTPIQIPAGTTVTYTLKAGISSNATAGHKNNLTVTAATIDDIDAIGASSNVQIQGAGNLTGGPITGTAQTVTSTGSLSIGLSSTDTTNPVRGAKSFELYKLTLAASGEDVKTNSVMFTLVDSAGNSSLSSDLANLQLFDGTTQVGQTITSVGSTATFSNLNYIVPLNTTKTLSLRADIPASATQGHTVQATVAANTDVSATGNASTTDLATGQLTLVNGTGHVYTVGQGTLAVTSATLPTATNYAIGSVDSEFARFYLSAQASNEDLSISSIAVSRVTGNITALDVQDLKLFDGTTQLGATQQLDSTPAAVFNLTTPLVIPKGTIKTISLMATPKTGLTNGHTAQFQLDQNGIDVTGVTSGAVSTAPSAGPVVFANSITVNSAAALVVALPGAVSQVSAKNLVQASTGNALFNLGFTASYSDVQVTQIVLTGNADTAADLSNISLWDGTTQVGTTIPQLDSNYKATFVLTNSPVTVTKGSDNYKVLTVKADVNSSTNSTLGHSDIMLGVASASDITARTAGSYITVTPTGGAGVAGYLTGAAGASTDLHLGGAATTFNIQVDGDSVPHPVVLTIGGDTTGVLTAADMQATIRAIVAAGYNYAGVTVAYVVDHYVITSASTGLGSIRVTAGAGATDVAAALKLTTATGATIAGGYASNNDIVVASSVTAVKAALPTTSPKLGAGIDLGRWTLTNNGPKSVTINKVELTDTMSTLNGTTTDSTFVLYNTDTGLLLTAPMAWATGSSTTDFTYSGAASLGDDTGGAAGATGIGITLASGKSITIGLRLASNAGTKPLVVNSSVAVRLVGQNANTTTSVVTGTSLAGTAVPVDNSATSDSVGFTS